MAAARTTKHIFITGGVLSSLGKGLASASIGALLEARGLRMLFFRVGGATIEVVGRIGAKPDRDARDRFGGLAWQVPDADAARERIAKAGFDVSEVRGGNKPGTRVCTVRGEPCGVPTLLIEPGA